MDPLDFGSDHHGRVLVLGDERVLNAEARIGPTDRVRALSGWSTSDQMRHLKMLELDRLDRLVLIWNHDDPDVGGVRYVELTWQHARRFLPARLLFPRTWDAAGRRINLFLERHVLSGYGKENWCRRLYDSDNLRAYGHVVHELVRLVGSERMRVLVLPPEEKGPDPRLDRALVFFEEAGVDVEFLQRWNER